MHTPHETAAHSGNGENAPHLRPRWDVIKLIGAWIVVLVPAIWGIAQTLKKAAALFH